MLENTFCHIPGVSARLECMLWEAGIHSWDRLRNDTDLPLSPQRVRTIMEHLHSSAHHLEQSNPLYFFAKLPSRQHWRLFPAFRSGTAYLDIETTGLGGPGDHITTIALYDGEVVYHYVYGENLEAFGDDIRRYDLLVTYNGKCFDVPFIRKSLGIPMTRAHIDLMHVMRGLGITGGLKGCEKKLGLDRKELDGVDGYFAVLLWQDYVQNGNKAALETLLAYNMEDVVNLETLMVIAYNLKLRDTPFFATHRLPLPARPVVPFRADIETIQRIRRRYYSHTI
jgi:uncharacterized protein YprB with RNaseH-like and TPR domain